jgi:hypothetical protein
MSFERALAPHAEATISALNVAQTRSEQIFRPFACNQCLYKTPSSRKASSSRVAVAMLVDEAAPKGLRDRFGAVVHSELAEDLF